MPRLRDGHVIALSVVATSSAEVEFVMRSNGVHDVMQLVVITVSILAFFTGVRNYVHWETERYVFLFFFFFSFFERYVRGVTRSIAVLHQMPCPYQKRSTPTNHSTAQPLTMLHHMMRERASPRVLAEAQPCIHNDAQPLHTRLRPKVKSGTLP
jgi:hypothetical protein